MNNPKLAVSLSLLAATLLLSAKWTNQRSPSGPHRRTLIYIRRYPMTTVLTAVMFFFFRGCRTSRYLGTLHSSVRAVTDLAQDHDRHWKQGLGI